MRSATKAGQEWLEREFDAVRFMAEWAACNGYPGFTWRIALELSTCVDRVLPWREAVEFYALALEAARTEREPIGEAYLLNALGCLHLVKDERLMAASYFEQAFTCFRQQNHAAGQELLHANLALVHAELGDADRADQHSRQASGRAYPADGEVWGRIGA
ncbi:hypothetical protein OG394_01435 [Kribbella sp. NBC_01245]|uniref:hypothetical protein n=1 Tax=Kribbella sp. NBC_01245 TaxID=2903578 RepID=UPI002E2D638A|nr:hypothetical protein [Kribbella sp. NBC_01245]